MVHWLKRRPFALALVGALALGACSDDDPTGVDDDHDHGENVAGMVLTLNGVEIARYDVAARTWDQGYTTEEGVESDHIDVTLVDEDGDEIMPDADYYLQVTPADETIAEWEQDEPGEFGGHIHGGVAGTTVMEFALMHGEVGSGHADIRSSDFTVTVTVPAL
jgi:hypothetical protein